MANTKKISELAADSPTDVLIVGDQLVLTRDGVTYGYENTDEFTIEYSAGAPGLSVNSDNGQAYVQSPDAASYVYVYDGNVEISSDGQVVTNNLAITDAITPTGNDDVTGVTGSIMWDEDFIYVKTVAGWARAAITLMDPT